MILCVFSIFGGGGGENVSAGFSAPRDTLSRRAAAFKIKPRRGTCMHGSMGNTCITVMRILCYNGATNPKLSNSLRQSLLVLGSDAREDRDFGIAIIREFLSLVPTSEEISREYVMYEFSRLFVQLREIMRACNAPILAYHSDFHMDYQHVLLWEYYMQKVSSGSVFVGSNGRKLSIGDMMCCYVCSRSDLSVFFHILMYLYIHGKKVHTIACFSRQATCRHAETMRWVLSTAIQKYCPNMRCYLLNNNIYSSWLGPYLSSIRTIKICDHLQCYNRRDGYAQMHGSQPL